MRFQACIETLSWFMYLPKRNVEDVRTKEFVEAICLIHSLEGIEKRPPLRSIIFSYRHLRGSGHRFVEAE
jgi:hypothetical protein